MSSTYKRLGFPMVNSLASSCEERTARSSEVLMAGRGAGLATFATFSFPRRCGSKATARDLWLGSRRRLKPGGVGKLCSKRMTSKLPAFTESSVSN